MFMHVKFDQLKKAGWIYEREFYIDNKDPFPALLWIHGSESKYKRVDWKAQKISRSVNYISVPPKWME